jgi:uncharacterized membrane protein YeaQ/YmgE (transglycosylase-associated protein family)
VTTGAGVLPIGAFPKCIFVSGVIAGPIVYAVSAPNRTQCGYATSVLVGIVGAILGVVTPLVFEYVRSGSAPLALYYSLYLFIPILSTAIGTTMAWVMAAQFGWRGRMSALGVMGIILWQWIFPFLLK